MCILWGKMGDAKYSFLEHIGQLETRPSCIFPPKEQNGLGAEWYTQLCVNYLKIGGTFPTSPYDFIKTFEREWNRLSDVETQTIYWILTEILGGISLEYNGYCLQTWILQNKDVVYNIHDWILTSYKSDN